MHWQKVVLIEGCTLKVFDYKISPRHIQRLWIVFGVSHTIYCQQQLQDQSLILFVSFTAPGLCLFQGSKLRPAGQIRAQQHFVYCVKIIYLRKKLLLW